MNEDVKSFKNFRLFDISLNSVSIVTTEHFGYFFCV